MRRQFSTSDVVIDFYSGAYGETIRIDVQIRRDLDALIELFRFLATGDRTDIDLAEYTGARPYNLGPLTLRTLADESLPTKTLSRVSGDPPTFVWSNTPAGWARCTRLLEVLCVDDLPAHQYLAEDESDDALIEVGYREYRPPSF